MQGQDLPILAEVAYAGQEGGGHSEHPAPRLCRRRHNHDLRHFNASGLIAAGCDVVRAESSRALKGDNDFEHLLAPVTHR